MTNIQGTINPYGDVLTLTSPKVLDGENDKITITVTVDTDLIKKKIYKDYFELSLDQETFPANEARVFNVKVVLEDDKSDKKETSEF